MRHIVARLELGAWSLGPLSIGHINARQFAARLAGGQDTSVLLTPLVKVFQQQRSFLVLITRMHSGWPDS